MIAVKKPNRDTTRTHMIAVKKPNREAVPADFIPPPTSATRYSPPHLDKDALLKAAWRAVGLYDDDEEDEPPAEEDIEQQVAPVDDIKESISSESAAAVESPRTVPNRPLRGSISQAPPAAVSSSTGAVIATIPVTIDDKATDLLIYEGQNPEEAVVAFCRTNVPDDVSSCIRQLLTTVLDKIAEGESI
jgi:hypothetical protein